MASSAEVAKRRQTVGELWLRGVPVLRIATQLGTPHRTIRSDIEVIRKQLQEDRLTELEVRRDRSVAVLRKVQQEAWILFLRVQDQSTNKVGTLNTVKDCEEMIAKLEGTLGPTIQQNTTVNVLASGEFRTVIATLLDALSAYPEARVAAADALMLIEEERQHSAPGA